MMNALVREARPKQWVKNILVFAAPGAAGVLDNGTFLLRAIVLFIAFCLTSSGTYFWNDLHDLEADRLHPTKCRRPIASGAVPVPIAMMVGTALVVVGLGISFTLGWETGLVVLLYVALTTSYSLYFKHVAVIDLIVVASGFVLRAVAGAVATDVPMSTWFVLTISFGSLFIVTGKRYAELRELGDDAARVRATLDDYTLGFLRIVLSVSVGATLVTYCLWAFEVREVSGSSWPFYELTIIPMVAAILRYTLILEQGHGAAPEEIFTADRTLQILGLIWLVVFCLGVYVG